MCVYVGEGVKEGKRKVCEEGGCSCRVGGQTKKSRVCNCQQRTRSRLRNADKFPQYFVPWIRIKRALKFLYVFGVGNNFKVKIFRVQIR